LKALCLQTAAGQRRRKEIENSNSRERKEKYQIHKYNGLVWGKGFNYENEYKHRVSIKFTGSEKYQ